VRARGEPDVFEQASYGRLVDMQRRATAEFASQNQPLLSQIVHVIFPTVQRLTRQEQLVLCIVLSLLLVGWAVKAWRTAHPSTRSNTELNLK
jgi:hypothetical protein